ncbi:MAG: PTS glucose transporter subunit IIA [Eubacterium sp.]|nr:PTS glucose transporter subunit IIA [Eubacterium sp.]
MGLFDRFKKGSQSPAQNETQAPTDPKAVYLPMNGRVIDLKEVGDGVFSEGMLGQGAAVEPSDGKVYAPFDGEVTMVYDTKHALGLMSKGGVELLIHIGLDTVNLEGKCFNIKVKDGQKIKKGELMAIADLDGIKKAGYKTVTPVIVTNSDDFEKIEKACEGTQGAGVKLLDVI